MQAMTMYVLGLATVLCGCGAPGQSRSGGGSDTPSAIPVVVTGWVGPTIDFTTSSAVVSLTHRIDVDPEDGGCLTGVSLRLAAGGEGCSFTLNFQNQSSCSQVALNSAVITADSFCPGWSNDEETSFELEDSGTMAATIVAMEAPAHDAQSATLEGELVLSGKLRLTQGLKVVFDDYKISGSFKSTGATQGQCLLTADCDDSTDTGGGDGGGPTYDDDVQPILAKYCDSCHTTSGLGGHNVASNFEHAGKPTSGPACAGAANVAECAILRIKNGSMPLGTQCTGDPDQDAENSDGCLTADEQATVQAWVDAGLPEFK